MFGTALSEATHATKIDSYGFHACAAPVARHGSGGAWCARFNRNGPLGEQFQTLQFLFAPRRRRRVFSVSRANAQMLNVAEHLAAFEASGAKSSGSKTPAALLAGEKLRPVLTTLMGGSGFRALLSRSLALASQESAWLRAVQVRADGSVGGLDELSAQVGPGEIAEGMTLVLAQLLGLLVAFIGAAQTRRVVLEVWPRLSLTEIDFAGGDVHEKAK